METGLKLSRLSGSNRVTTEPNAERQWRLDGALYGRPPHSHVTTEPNAERQWRRAAIGEEVGYLADCDD